MVPVESLMTVLGSSVLKKCRVLQCVCLMTLSPPIIGCDVAQVLWLLQKFCAYVYKYFNKAMKRICIMERPERVASVFVETRTQGFGCSES